KNMFHDATSIGILRLLRVVVVGGAAAFSAGSLASAVWSFAYVFAGGIAVGWAAALVAGLLLGWVEDNAFIELTITTVLAYLSFVLADTTLNLSGVMAALAAGLVIGGWGKAKITPEVNEKLDVLWSYLADVANALLFL